MPKLRDYQIDIIGQVERLDHPLIPLPTGGGKTVIAAAMTEKAVKAQQQRVVFMVHRRELVTHASAKLRAVGVDHAILMGAESTEYLGQRCIVASTQTLYARAFRTRKIDRPPADIIIFDEAHHCRARTYLELRKAYPDAKIIGLTATPARGDGRGLGGDLFSDLVEVPSYAWLIENKYLVRPVVFARPLDGPWRTAIALNFAKLAVGDLKVLRLRAWVRSRAIAFTKSTAASG